MLKYARRVGPSAAAMRHIVTHSPKGHPRFESQVSTCPYCCQRWSAQFQLNGRLEWRKL